MAQQNNSITPLEVKKINNSDKIVPLHEKSQIIARRLSDSAPDGLENLFVPHHFLLQYTECFYFT